ncbi:hypothetical protein [Occallatibacter savannae]|uniref:hypothetical protein n=1 Tax=Occallatibacter savannae TaxID=1002691 RepID=UPI000D69CD6C|nr:hypothetical protein [Occallatibacter savannae]
MPSILDEKLSAPVLATEDATPTPAKERPRAASTAAEIFNWTKALLLSQTHLSEEEAELVTFWMMSTWSQDALKVLPCLVINGPAHQAMRVMQVLNNLCYVPVLVPGFRRGDLEALRCCMTFLILEPSLSRRTADLLSALTEPSSRVVAGSSFLYCSRAIAVYAGEDPETPEIWNCLHIHMSRSSRNFTSPSTTVQAIMERLPGHLNEYRERNLEVVKNSAWRPSGLRAEIEAVATELGRCIVDAPELREKLVTLLKAHDEQRLSDLSSSTDAVLLEAVLALIHKGKSQSFAREIAEEFNRMQKTYGERLSYTPEKVGHTLKKLGLFTRRLGREGRGLVMDLATIKRVHELARMHGGASLDLSEGSLHCPQCNESARIM